MRVLVIVASKHGGTRGIAGALVDGVRSRGIESDLSDVSEPFIPSDYDVVVLGSAVYMGRWLPEALSFVATNQQALVDRKVWLFSSGPLGDPPKGSIDPGHLAKLMADTKARGHQLFSGSIDPDDLSMKEKLVAKAVRAPSGDFRDWDAVRTWAHEIVADAHTPALTNSSTGASASTPATP